MLKKRHKLRIGRHEIAISHPAKVLFRSCMFRKAELIDYYVRVAPFLLPHLKNRPVTLKRFSDRAAFEKKNPPAPPPKWIKRFPTFRRKDDPHVCHILINNAATLAWAANLTALELHPFLHRIPRINEPTHVVFDLDPGEGVDFLQCAEVAIFLRDLLSKLGLKSFAKVSGPKEIQVYLPLNVRVTYAATEPFAGAIAELLAEQHREMIVAEMAKILRKNKVFVDWSRNARDNTTVGVYSLRAKGDRPYISMPVRWEELKKALRKGNTEDLCFEPEAALRRLQKLGDLFAPVLKLKQRLPEEFMTLPDRKL